MNRYDIALGKKCESGNAVTSSMPVTQIVEEMSDDMTQTIKKWLDGAIPGNFGFLAIRALEGSLQPSEVLKANVRILKMVSNTETKNIYEDHGIPFELVQTPPGLLFRRDINTTEQEYKGILLMDLYATSDSNVVCRRRSWMVCQEGTSVITFEFRIAF